MTFSYIGERVSNMDELRAKNFKNVVVKTSKGKKIEADLAIPCTGLKVNRDAYKTSLGMWDQFLLELGF
jgi:hypothetical protein